MATLNQDLKTQSTTHPEALLQVVLTSSKSPEQLQAIGVGSQLQPIQGLDGIYKATLTGRQLLALEHNPDIDTIEHDAEVVTLDKD
jgi:hypothetical protein